MKRIHSLAFLAVLAGCPAKKNDDKAADKPAPAGDKKPEEVAATPGGDPEKGDFTLEEATAGLAGTGTLTAKISTPQGDITCELFPDKAPKTVANFVGLARGLRAYQDDKGGWKKDKYFDGLAFHRVIPEFMIQGGDVLSKDYQRPDIGSGGPGYQFVNETHADLKFDRPGRLAMANAGPDTNGSQFFVTEVPKGMLDGGYTIFGQCDGNEVVKTIARVAVDSPRHNKPLEPVTMRVEIFPAMTRAGVVLALVVLAGAASAQAQAQAQTKKAQGPLPLPLPVPVDPVGGWKAEMTANYSTCVETKLGQTRSVRWRFARDAKKPDTLSLIDRGEKGETAKTFVGGTTDAGGFELRAGKTAGLDLRAQDDRLLGRLVVSRKLGCVVIYDVVAERSFDEPIELGETDPDAGFSLAQALVGLPPGNTVVADLITDAGTITCELYPERAPIAVANFVGLARGLRAWKDPKRGKFVRYKPFYDGQAFHRVIPGFIIQAGDPLSRDWTATAVGTGGPGYTIADEQSGLRFDQPGRLAMANKGPGTNSGGSQFFISEIRAPQLDGAYTVFGQCTPLEIIKVAARVPSNSQTNKPDLPLSLQKVVIHR